MHEGLKIRFSQGSAGSSPAARTSTLVLLTFDEGRSGRSPWALWQGRRCRRHHERRHVKHSRQCAINGTRGRYLPKNASARPNLLVGCAGRPGFDDGSKAWGQDCTFRWLSKWLMDTPSDLFQSR
jgi:hypothetical protein